MGRFAKGGGSLNPPVVSFSSTKAFYTGISLAWQGPVGQTRTSQGSSQQERAQQTGQLTAAASSVQVHGVKSAGVPGEGQPPLCSVSTDQSRASRNPLHTPWRSSSWMFDLSLGGFLAWHCHPHALRLPLAGAVTEGGWGHTTAHHHLVQAQLSPQRREIPSEGQGHLQGESPSSDHVDRPALPGIR